MLVVPEFTASRLCGEPRDSWINPFSSSQTPRTHTRNNAPTHTHTQWRGKPIFIRHRTADEIAEANEVSLTELRHQETDAERTQKPEWLVMLGVCTHLGCVPIGEGMCGVVVVVARG